MALTLSSGGVASHSSAVALYGLLQPPKRRPITVTHAGRSRSERPGRTRRRCCPQTDIRTVDHIPATAPARTLIDLQAMRSAASSRTCSTWRSSLALSHRRVRVLAPWICRLPGDEVVGSCWSWWPTRSGAPEGSERMGGPCSPCACGRASRPRSNFRFTSVVSVGTSTWPGPTRRLRSNSMASCPIRCVAVFYDDRVRQNDLVAVTGWSTDLRRPPSSRSPVALSLRLQGRS